MHSKLTLEYDGTAFRGWARQPGQRTVEGVLREALETTYPGWDGLVAGRTDTGVHAKRQLQLCLTAATGNLLDRVALLVAAEEVHATVDTGRIAPQGVLDKAHALDVLAPVDLRTEPKAGDRIRDRHLRHALPLMLAADRLFGGHLLRPEVALDRLAQQRNLPPVLADAQEQLHDGRDVGLRRPGQRASRVRVLQMVVGDQARAARDQNLVGEPTQVLDQRQRQHARPGPELADRQRRDALVGVQEQPELLPLEPAVAVAHQLDRHRVDPGAPALLARGERRQLPVVGPGQIAMDLGELRGDEMEVVEQPFRRRGDEPPGPHVGGERLVRVVEGAGVALQAWADAPGAPARIDREASGERERALVQPLGAEELVAERPFGRSRRLASPELSEWRTHVPSTLVPH